MLSWRQEYRSERTVSSVWLVVADLRRIRIFRNLRRSYRFRLQVSDFNSLPCLAETLTISMYSASIAFFLNSDAVAGILGSSGGAISYLFPVDIVYAAAAPMLPSSITARSLNEIYVLTVCLLILEAYPGITSACMTSPHQTLRPSCPSSMRSWDPCQLLILC